MKNEQVNEITSKAIEQLIAALNEGRTETLTRYVAAIGPLHRSVLHSFPDDPNKAHRSINLRTEAVAISPAALPPTHRTLLPWAPNVPLQQFHSLLWLLAVFNNLGNLLFAQS